MEYLAVSRAFLNLYSHSGAIAWSQDLGAERPLQAMSPQMCLHQVPEKSLG